MRSAVRLFWFLIGVSFQQIPPLLLLVSSICLTTCMGMRFGREIGGGGMRFGRKIGENGYAVWSWKTLWNHTSLWK